MDKTYVFYVGHTPKVGFYIVNFFLLFLNKSQKDPTFGFYNLAHSDVTILSPLLFLLVLNDLPTVTESRETNMYADDTEMDSASKPD